MITYDSLLTIKYHLTQGLRYMETAPDSPFPGFDCGLTELQLAYKTIDDCITQIIKEEESE